MELRKDFEAQGSFLFKYRSILPLILLAFTMIFFIYNEIIQNPNVQHLTNEYMVICLAVSFFGLAIRIFTVGFTPKNTSGRNTKEQIADKLNTTGIYSLVRHPLYIGNFFMWLGAAMLTGSSVFVIIFFLVYWIYYERIMYAEEQFLHRKFGDSFIAWSDEIPAVVPDFNHWQNSEQAFNLKKIIKKEKNGVVAIFILFFLFDRIHIYYNFPEKLFDANVWFFLMAGTIMMYLIIRVLRKRTRLL